MSLQKYSVLMSVYAKEKPEFLRESMMSMYEQTVPTDDFVLICDGSLNEGLDSVIDEMAKMFGERLRVFRFSKNHGLGYALKFGVEKCKNELIARMDSDDISVKDRFERELRGFEKNSDLAVVGSNIVEYDEKMEKQLANKNVPEENEHILQMMKKRNPMNHMSVMFRKNKVLAAGNYLEMPFFEDYYLWIRMAKNGDEFYNVPEALVKVRGGVGMFQRRGGLKYAKSVVKFQKAIRKVGFVSFARTCVNMSERLAVALVPNGVRRVIYSGILRRGI